MKPNIEISDKNRQNVADILNTLLSDEYLLYTQTRNAHWNIAGSNFSELHKFFESQYEMIDEIIDDVAERVRSIGHYSLGSLKDFLRLSRISENKELSEEKEALRTLLAGHETIIQALRKEIPHVTDKYLDLGTADFITGIMEHHEKMAWMLRAYLS
ncbi:MAG: Dps family protein [Bacteroidia bacterium]